MKTAETVREFWRLMGTNNFDSVAAVFAPEVVIDWPQSNERICGPDNFAQLNREYPSNGPWKFTVKRLVADGTHATTHTSITDGVQNAEAISFFTVADGKITHLEEYWPEPYTAPENRAHLTLPIC